MPFKKGESGNPDRMFSKENQPAKRGRKGKSTTEYLRELGDADELIFHLEITKKNGQVDIRKGKIKSQSDLNQLLATLLWMDAIQGNHKARKEILDRVEGRPMQSHKVGGDPDNPIEQKISIEIVRSGK